MRRMLTGLILLGGAGISRAGDSMPAANVPGFPFHAFGSTDPVSIRETISPADIDGDGDRDFFSSGGGSVWFENAGKGDWIRRAVGDSFDTDVGASAFDVDGDGRVDRASGSFWHRNRGTLSGPAFDTFRFRAGLGLVHDQLAAVIDGDGRIDIIDIDYNGIRWFRNPPDPTVLWSENYVNDGTESDGFPQHGGLAAGDIDGDGDVDVARLNRWFENADGKGSTWINHGGIGFGKSWESGWGLSGRALLFDLDLDGSLDLVQGDCDHPNGQLAIFFNKGGKGRDWKRLLLKDSVDEQDFHSLAIADFDGDGDADVFSMGGPNSRSTPAAYIWENRDGKGGSWMEHVIHRGWDGHEATALDLDGDGDLDIIAKSWNLGLHFRLENTRISHPQSLRPRGNGRVGRPRNGRMSPGFEFRAHGRIRDAAGRLVP